MIPSVETFRPHVLSISLEGTAEDIEARLLPPATYYKGIRERLPGAEAFDIERSILQKWKKEDIGKIGKYGEPWRNHVLRFMKILIPSTIITPAFMDEMYAVELCIMLGREITNFIGAKSAGKTAAMARLALTLVCADPDYTVAYVAAPYKNVADYTIWSEIEGCYSEIERHHGAAFPDLRSLPSKNLFLFSASHAKAGKIQLIGLDQVSKFQGAKARDQRRGFFLLVADEIGVFPSNAFVEIIGNVTANQNFLGLTGCNFKSILGMDGILCDPIGSEYQNLRLEHDHLWLSSYKSITLRLDGHLSPNVLEKRKIDGYHFLLTEEKRANLEEIHGLRGAKYLEQVRSFPNTSSGEQFVLTLEQIRAGGCYDKFWNKAPSIWIKVCFMDPGWGGDPCKIGGFEFGKASVQAHDGSHQIITVFRPLGPIETIRVQSGVTVDAEVLSKISRFSKGPIMTKEGREYSKELQMALGAAEFLERHQIPVANFGFDASMRGEIVRELVTVLGPEVVPYDTMNKPTEMVMDSNAQTAAMKYRNLRSEMFFTFATIVTSGQFRDADLIQDAIGQICRHRVVRAGVKEALESKDDYKKMNQGKSPDSGDVAVGAAHMARRRGFELAMNKKQAITMANDSMFSLSAIKPPPQVARLSRR